MDHKTDQPEKSQDDDNNSDHESSEIREELRNMSFAELMKLKEELGSKVYNEAVFGVKSVKDSRSKIDFKRENKNRPREMSAKRPVPLINFNVKDNQEVTVRDPRFDSKCGEYNMKSFKKNYDFINDIRMNEVQELKRKLHQASNDEEKHRIKFLIQRLENQNQEEIKRKRQEEISKEEQKEIKKAKEEGKQPYYQKKNERRAKELVGKFLELKESGKLGRHLEKRRKKNATKDRKKLKFN